MLVFSGVFDVSIVDSSSIFKRKKTPGGMKYAKKGIPCTLGEQEGEREKRYCCYRTKECWGKTSTTSHGTSHCRMSPPTVRPIGEITPDLYMISKFLWLYSLPSCHITNFMTTAWDIVNRKWKTQILGKPCIDTATTVALYKRSLMYLNFHTWGMKGGFQMRGLRG